MTQPQVLALLNENQDAMRRRWGYTLFYELSKKNPKTAEQPRKASSWGLCENNPTALGSQQGTVKEVSAKQMSRFVRINK